MILNNLIRIYKNKRKQAILDNVSPSYSHKYAFVGVGQHSLSTFYPILSFINTPLKYILTEKSSFGKQVASKFPSSIATNDYDAILQDPEVKGIFISGTPSSHFDLTYKALKHHKNVFVEKPVCFSLSELQQLISICQMNCIVGLQKRYSTINTFLKNKQLKPLYYSGRYSIGRYPEGDPLYELFIHPIDNLTYLFGEATVAFSKRITNKDGVTLMLYLEHSSGVNGTLELSTDHNWNDPIDTLRLELPDETISINYPGHIESISKEKSLFGIPLNKIFQSPVEKRILYNNTGIINNIERNTLYEAGYFNEIKEFISLVESNKVNTKATSSIHQLIDTYKLMEYIAMH